MSVRTPSPFERRREYLRAPIGRSPVRDVIGQIRTSFLMSTQEVFSPDDIASLSHWYDATELTGFNDGDSVGTWPDAEGTDDLTQGTVEEQPTYQTGVIGGRPIVRFDGSNDSMAASFADISQPNTIFAVAALTGSGDPEILYSGDDSTNRNQIWKDSSNHNAWEMYAGNSIRGGTPDTNPHIFTAVFDGASSKLEVDNNAVISADAGAAALSGFVACEDPSGNNGAADVGEYLVYDGSLTSSEESDVETYLSDRWDITLT